MDIIISYDINKDIFTITEENASYSIFRLIGKSVKPVKETKDLKTALNYIGRIEMLTCY